MGESLDCQGKHEKPAILEILLLCKIAKQTRPGLVLSYLKYVCPAL